MRLLEPLQRRAEAEPGRQSDASLRPREDPRNGPQRVDPRPNRRLRDGWDVDRLAEGHSVGLLVVAGSHRIAGLVRPRLGAGGVRAGAWPRLARPRGRAIPRLAVPGQRPGQRRADSRAVGAADRWTVRRSRRRRGGGPAVASYPRRIRAVDSRAGEGYG